MPAFGGPGAPARGDDEFPSRRPGGMLFIRWLIGLIRSRRSRTSTATSWNEAQWLAEVGRNADWGGDFGDPWGRPR